MPLKAKETKYRGYRTRSRLEARWMVFLDTLGEPFEYEKEGYELEDGLSYLPDFWLSNQQCWVEIKGDGITPEEGKKARLLAEQSGYPVFIFSGQIEPAIIRKNEKQRAYLDGGSVARYFEPKMDWLDSMSSCLGWLWAGCSACHTVGVVGLWRLGTVARACCDCPSPRTFSATSPRLQRAYDAARSARFEFGESGAGR